VKNTCDELIDAFSDAGWDKSTGVIVLTGAGDRAFCTGGNQSAHDEHYDGRGTIGMPLEQLHGVMREVPKPVIARAGLRHRRRQRARNALGFQALSLYYQTDESKEGVKAFMGKRKPYFRKRMK
jgi:1,4-dihydroxy-2-naphthoyl-CoA synthase